MKWTLLDPWCKRHTTLGMPVTTCAQLKSILLILNCIQFFWWNSTYAWNEKWFENVQSNYLGSIPHIEGLRSNTWCFEKLHNAWKFRKSSHLLIEGIWGSCPKCGNLKFMGELHNGWKSWKLCLHLFKCDILRSCIIDKDTGNSLHFPKECIYPFGRSFQYF
jgi:hypothetical protein